MRKISLLIVPIFAVSFTSCFAANTLSCSCPSVSEVQQMIKNFASLQGNNVATAGTTWSVGANFNATQVNPANFKFHYATLNADQSTGGPAAAVCQYADGSNHSIGFATGGQTAGEGVAVKSNNNWMGCGATESGGTYPRLCCGPGYSSATAPDQCTFTIAPSSKESSRK